MAKKKKRPKQLNKAGHDPGQQEARDELLALQAIFPDIELSDDGLGLKLVVRPHLGDADSSFVSVTVHIRCERQLLRTCVP